MARPLNDMETLFKSLGDATRLRILGLLLTGEVCVCDLHDTLGIPQPKASRHLAYLRAAGLVDARREGQWMHYRLSDSRDPVIDVTSLFTSDVAEFSARGRVGGRAGARGVLGPVKGDKDVALEARGGAGFRDDDARNAAALDITGCPERVGQYGHRRVHPECRHRCSGR